MGLFKPGWQSKSVDKALKAVEEEMVQDKLAEIAKNAPLNDVKKAAIRKLTDPSMLFSFINYEQYLLPRETAIHRMIELKMDNSYLWKVYEKLDTFPSHTADHKRIILNAINDEQSILEMIKDERNKPNSALKPLRRLINLPNKPSNEIICKVLDYFPYPLRGMIQDEYGSWKNNPVTSLSNIERKEYEILCKTITEMLTPDFFVWYFKNNHNLDTLETLSYFGPESIKSMIVKACNEIKDEYRLREIYTFFKIVDKDIIKNECEIGEHSWVAISSKVEDNHATTDNYVTYWDVTTYKCRLCSETKTESKVRQ